MSELKMQDYKKPSADHEEISSSDDSKGLPLSNALLEKHGYTIKEECKSGVSGKVFLVMDTDGDVFVIKEIICRDKKSLRDVKTEVEILKTLKHGYIVSYEDSFEDNEAGFFYIVMEYCAGGDLSQRMKIQKEKAFFEEEQILDWLVQICLALQYIHNEKGILHRDIKPQNVFLTDEDYINVGDFGCSKVLESADAYAQSVVGAELYVSPEVYKKKYNFKSDIWSLGWLLHDLCMLDIWATITQRRLIHALSMTGVLPQISERYSQELRELIKQMLSCDPKGRPSAEDILAKPFLKEAVIKNKRIPKALEQNSKTSITAFVSTYQEHYKNFEVLVDEWGKTTDSLEEIHYGTTAGSLSGAVIGTAGGITAVVGAILAPFTFGASLIVAGVGIGVAVAGGVTGAASNITNTVKQKQLGEKIEKLKQEYERVSTPILNSLKALKRLMRKITKFHDFVSNSTFVNVQMSWRLGRTTVTGITQFLTLAMLASFGRIAIHSAKAVRAVAAASGVLSGILVIADVVFIVKDSREIHQMRQQWRTDDPEKVKSNVLKSIAQMRKTHKELCNVLEDVRKAREELKEYIEMDRDG
ncbi:serine/threonine-protein kinase Nek9-like isoform X2 [Danio aesculapii]|uniref:serine/threonine-protein kinase Nek9-like isoform X2 n=1 Tax=Danio aesculapii TaxID=1142201 RepID=UPI0024BFC2F2|nr:serine/threonine-protein kinase Nek9-like isoform X2 [Danio aesculapii]